MKPDAIAAYGEALMALGIGVALMGPGLLVIVVVVGFAALMNREERGGR